MKVLTDEERALIVLQHLQPEADDIHHIMRYTDAIEAAVIAKLAAGVSVEPVAVSCKCNICGEWQYATSSGMVCKNGHGGATATNVRAFTPGQLQTALAAARVQENERLAKHFDAKPGCEMFGGGIADEIRDLLGKEAT